MRIVRLPFKKRSSKENSSLLAEFINLSKKTFLFLFLFSAFINLLLLLPSIYMLAVYDVVIPTQSENSLIAITILVIILYGLLFSLQYIRSRIMYLIHLKFEKFLSKPSFEANFEIALKNKDNTAQIIEDFNTIKNFLTSPAALVFFDIPWVPIFLIFLFLLHPLYGIVGIFFLVIIIILSIVNEISTKKYFKISNEKLIIVRKFLMQIMNNAEAVYALGMLNNVYRKWNSLNREFINSHDTAIKNNNFWSQLTKTFRMLAQSLVYGVGGLLVIKKEITGGMIIAGAIALGRALAPIDMLIASWKNINSAFLAYKRLKESLKTFEEEKENKSFQVKRGVEIKGKIELLNVISIAPGSKKPILSNISLAINPGNIVSVIGPNGSGKSSLLKTILGIYPIVEGKVLIDGIDINEWDMEFLGKFIGYLPQEIELLEGSVAENIARFGKIEEAKVIEAAKLAGAHEYIASLPDGYNTQVGPNGAFLSGGLRQRIALARALYGNPKIVLLDEPNSNLDDAGILSLIKTLKQLKQMNKTVVMVTHHMGLIGVSDKTLLLREGQLKIYGPTQQVLEVLRGKSNKN